MNGYSNYEIWNVVNTGGNIMVISGITKGGKYFVCDQYGDGDYLAEPYDINWTYEEEAKAIISAIPEEDAKEIIRLYEIFD